MSWKKKSHIKHKKLQKPEIKHVSLEGQTSRNASVTPTSWSQPDKCKMKGYFYNKLKEGFAGVARWNSKYHTHHFPFSIYIIFLEISSWRLCHDEILQRARVINEWGVVCHFSQLQEVKILWSPAYLWKAQNLAAETTMDTTAEITHWVLLFFPFFKEFKIWHLLNQMETEICFESSTRWLLVAAHFSTGFSLKPWYLTSAKQPERFEIMLIKVNNT